MYTQKFNLFIFITLIITSLILIGCGDDADVGKTIEAGTGIVTGTVSDDATVTLNQPDGTMQITTKD